MRSMKSEDLVAIIDFLYSGEANVYQENLDTFLAIAAELQLKGLTGEQEFKEHEILCLKIEMKLCLKLHSLQRAKDSLRQSQRLLFTVKQMEQPHLSKQLLMLS